MWCRAVPLLRSRSELRDVKLGEIGTNRFGGAPRAHVCIRCGNDSNRINHGDAILRGDLPTVRLLQMGLTVMVPYMVSTFSSVGAMLEKE